MSNDELLMQFERIIMAAAGKAYERPELALELCVGIYQEVHSLSGDANRDAVLTNCVSVIINAATELSDLQALQQAEQMTASLMDSPHLEAFRKNQVRYNRANCLTAIYDIGAAEHYDNIQDPSVREPEHLKYRITSRKPLSEARSLLSKVGHSDDSDSNHQTRSLCNLANLLDSSGRWVEAYDAYVSALEVDPTNGNAAGNAAVLIRRAMSLDFIDGGHGAVLSNRFVRIAQSNLDRVVQLAGQNVAQRWSELNYWTCQTTCIPEMRRTPGRPG